MWGEAFGVHDLEVTEATESNASPLRDHYVATHKVRWPTNLSFLGMAHPVDMPVL